METSENEGRADQRELIAATLAELVSEHGLRQTDLSLLLRESGLDQQTFEYHFAAFDRCCVEIWEERAGEFLESTGAAFFNAETWSEGMRAAAWTYCRYIEEDRHRARFLIEMSFGSELVQASRDFIMETYAKLMHLGTQERPEAADPPFATAEGIVGLIWEKVATKILADELTELGDAFPGLIYLTVLPYVGNEAAQAELRRANQDLVLYRRKEIFPSARQLIGARA